MDKKERLEELKMNLDINQISEFLAEHGGDPIVKGDVCISRTICHNPPGEGSHKLYYYDNTHLFKCYTDCSEDSFDIFQLTLKIKRLAGMKILKADNTYRDYMLPDAIRYVAAFFNIELPDEKFSEDSINLSDWKIFSKIEANNSISVNTSITSLKVFDFPFLKNYPQPRILNWEKEGISPEIMKARNIYYDPINGGVIIPHYNIDNELVGIRERTFVKENEEMGKYKPAYLNGKMYNHPLGFNLYNINWSKYQIHNMRKVIVFEGEKSCLLFASYFGLNNDISVAACGSNLINYQVQLLVSLGVNEIIIAFDKQYQKTNNEDKEWVRWTKKLTELHNKYGAYVQISYLFDKQDILKYKDSPIDEGIDNFLYLFNNRIVL